MDLFKLYPDTNGEDTKRQEFLSLIESLIIKIDDLRDGESATLAGSLDRDYKKIIENGVIPEQGVSYDTLLDELQNLVQGNPIGGKFAVFNAHPLSSIPSLLGHLTSAIINSNSIWDIVSPAAAEAEIKVSAMMARVLGYDPYKSNGYFTYGGQGGTAASLRIGIEKTAPGSRYEGIPNNLYCFTSSNAHFSLHKAVETGMGMNRVILISTNEDGSMNLNELYEKMSQALADGGRIALVQATMGSTDTFAIDDIKGIKEIIDHLVTEYQLDYVPHLHADGAMGGLYSFFNLYDFENNPLGFDLKTLQGLYQIHADLHYIHLADSISIDFHKLGQTPYNCSIFMVKNSTDLNLVNLAMEHCPYIGEMGYGEYFTSYTIECSRMASSITALATLLTFGIEGYQKLLGQYIQMTIAFRDLLKQKSSLIKPVNRKNYGPCTIFRVYYNETEYVTETKNRATAQQLQKINELNTQFYNLLRMNRHYIMFGDTKKSDYKFASDTDEKIAINGTKAFIISPYTDLEALDIITDYVVDTYHQLVALISDNAKEELK